MDAPRTASHRQGLLGVGQALRTAATSRRRLLTVVPALAATLLLGACNVHPQVGTAQAVAPSTAPAQGSTIPASEPSPAPPVSGGTTSTTSAPGPGGATTTTTSTAPPATSQGQTSGAAGRAPAIYQAYNWPEDQKSTSQWKAIAQQYGVVALNAWDASVVPVLHGANSSVRAWVYKDLTSTRSDDCTTSSGDCILNGVTCPAGVQDSAELATGVGFCWAWRNHRDWFLTRPDGSYLVESGYSTQYEMDYGNPAYQQAWVQGVTADVAANHWDGVEVDNALSVADNYGVAARYPSDAAVQEHTLSMLEVVGPDLARAGIPAVFNVGYDTAYPQLWSQWLPYVGGLEQEFYLSSWSTTTDTNPTEFLYVYQPEVSSCAAAHKVCWFHVGDYSGAVTTQAADFGLASLLLASDGHQMFGFDTMERWLPELGWNLGTPTGPVQMVGGAWERSFSGGQVVANPSGSPVTVALGRTLVDASGSPVTSVTVAAQGGVLLRTPAW